jgi:cell fate regulator YaaT (PSP1 superfamily)
MAKVVGVRFRLYGKTYNFDCGHFVLNLGDKVMVKTDIGMSLGTVVRPPKAVEEDQLPKELKPIYRMATEEDTQRHDKNCEVEREAHAFCQDCIRNRKLDMNLVMVEMLFDNSKMIFYFTAEGRIDFREIVKDLVQRFRTRIEMRQIGVRNQTKMVGGIGSCGRELCCTLFIDKFEPVSVKMAKEQQLSLNPSKISGLCGRLMCCLSYEYGQYVKLRESMPKCGERIETRCCKGKVVRQNVLRSTISVVGDDGKEVEVSLAELREPVKAPGGKKKPDKEAR